MESFNWLNLSLYTKLFKEWVLVLFRKVQARIGHVEKDLYKLSEEVQDASRHINYLDVNLIKYYDDTTKDISVLSSNISRALNHIAIDISVLDNTILKEQNIQNISIGDLYNQIDDVIILIGNIDSSNINAMNTAALNLLNIESSIYSIIDTYKSVVNTSIGALFTDTSIANASINQLTDKLLLDVSNLNNLISYVDTSINNRLNAIDLDITDISVRVATNKLDTEVAIMDLSTNVSNELVDISNAIDDLSSYIANNLTSSTESINTSINDIADRLQLLDSSVAEYFDNVKISITTGQTFPADPKHGDYFILEEYLKTKYDGTDWVPDTTTDPKRTAYIWDETLNGGAWVALDGNVDATNVYFKDGINRTISFGSLIKNDITMINEAKDMNLKDLLEYYLVKEEYETPIIKNATFLAPNFVISSGDSKPKNLYEYIMIDGIYMTSNSSLCLINSYIDIDQIDLTINYTYSDTDLEKLGTPPSITYPIIKQYSKNGIDIINGSIYEGYTPKAEYSYSDTFDTATATITLTKISGFAGTMDTESATITDINNNNLLINSMYDTIVEGENKLSLSYVINGASATRVVDNYIDAIDVNIYGVSNIGNISTNTNNANGIAIDQSNILADDSDLNYTTNNVIITGVYNIYTNGGSVSLKPSKSIGGTYSSEPISIGMWDYIHNNTYTIYIKFGSTSNNTREIYFPTSSNYTFNITFSKGWDPTNKDYTDNQVWQETATTKVINGSEYKVWQCNQAGLGANEIMFKITKI